MSQGTQVEVEIQHVDVGANRLLGLEGVAVQLVELAEDGARVVHVSTSQESAAACPACGVVSTSVKGHARTRLRGLPYRPGASGVAQATVAMPEASVPKGFVHRVCAQWPGLGSGDHAAAVDVWGRGR